MKLCETLAINLKYYRKKYNLSQEKFAEVLGTTLSYLNQIENNKVDVKTSTIDKFAIRINEYDKKTNIKSEDLVKFNKKHITNFSRIDERTKN
ncbi:MAG: helix-turn-helix transcriptional regulator [Bacilli bacterium]|nr:helix-turn-helix transcriptional regulator [Bacilli bacterium]